MIKFIYALLEGTSQKYCVLSRYMMLIFPITGYSNFDHLVKILFALFLHYEVIIFFLFY